MWGPVDNGWWGFGMMLASFLFVALVVVGVVIIAKSSAGNGQTTRPSDNNRALDILDERFARGDVDRQEYEERRSILTGGRTA